MSKQVPPAPKAPTDPTLAGRSRALAPAERGAGLAAFDWAESALPALGQAMASRDVDLGTALCVFFRGEPERFNYMPRRDIPERFHATARLLDNICQRINSGFYLPQPRREVACRKALETWLGYQRSDAAERRQGRWCLNERVIAPILDPSWCDAPAHLRPSGTVTGFWRAVMAPLRGFCIDRDLLK